MDNENFGFPGVDINIPLNTLSGNEDITGTFQGAGNLVGINFEPENFPTHNDNFFEEVNSAQITKQDFGPNFNVQNQQIQSIDSLGSNEVQISLESSGVVCSMAGETHLRVYQDTSEFQIRSNQNDLPYQSNFSQEVKENATSLSYAGDLQTHPDQQFVTDMSSSQEFSDQFAPSLEEQFQDYQSCQPQENNFVSKAASLNSEVDSNLLESSLASEYPSKTLDPSYGEDACETSSSQFLGRNEGPIEKNVLETETPAFPSCNGSTITETLLPAEGGEYVDYENTSGAATRLEGNADSNLTAEKAAVAPCNTDQDMNPHLSCSLVTDTTQGDISKDEDPVLADSNCKDTPELTSSPPDNICEIGATFSPEGNISKDEDPVLADSNCKDTPELTSNPSPDNICGKGATFSPEARSSHHIPTPVLSPCPEDETESKGDKPEESDGQSSLNQMSPKSEKSVASLQVEEVAGSEEACSEESRQSAVIETEDCEPSEPAKEMRAAEVSDTEKESAEAEDDAIKENKLPQEDSSCQSGKEMETTDDTVTDSSGVMPLSPMITMLDDNMGEDGEITVKSENNNSSQKEKKDAVEASKDAEDSTPSVRLTRTRTGALRNKTQRLVEDMDASDESSQDSRDNSLNEEWEYEEGAETAPCPKDPFITVPDNVLEVTPDELAYYHKFFARGIEAVLKMRLHCTTCGRHIGAAPNYIHLGNRHKVLRVLICNRCRSFYGVGKFPRDSDGSELYCRWCGQGGQVICCSQCPNVFCENCIKRNVGPAQLRHIANLSEWSCFLCDYHELWHLRAVCWALLTYTMRLKKDALSTSDSKKILSLEEDKSKCCPSITNKRRKSRNKSQVTDHNVRPSVNNSLSAEEMLAKESFGFGHFLFPNDNFGSTMEQQELMEDQMEEEEDFIDPSQFVQPVLEEMSRPSSSRLSRFTPAPHPQRQISPAPGLIGRALPYRPQMTTRPQVTTRPQMVSRPQVTTRPQMTSRPQVNLSRFNHTSQQSVLRSSAPRIIIRQGNLMQPGLVPINNQPNSISITATRPSLALSRTQTPARGPVRNPAGYLNNIDGVRSMDQLQSLEHAPWFRDGIDSIRAVGFALTKRIRELEARFHSLKNKSDAEKVMILGKKLERLSRRTEHRFKQINSNVKQGSRDWYIKKTGCSKHILEHPFNLLNEGTSDWEDDKELTKPLEKVLIPVNTASLQSTVHNVGNVINVGSTSVVNSSVPPPLVRTSSVSSNSVLRGAAPSGGMRNISRLSSVTSSGNAASSGTHTIGRLSAPTPSVAGQPVTVRTVYSSANQANFTRIRLPGPKSSANRYVQVHKQFTSLTAVKSSDCITERVGAFLNERNGQNKISISLASSSKRKTPDSMNSDSDSDVEIYPTIPELIKMHQIRPCLVRLEKCDDFIVEFLEKQKQSHSPNISTCNLVSDSDSEDSEPPEVETIVCDGSESVAFNCDNQNDQENSSNDDHMNSDDDDIEIIHEVNAPISSVEESSNSNYVETIDDL